MEWLTAKEAAAYLKVGHRTLLYWARSGKIPAHKLSGTQRHVFRFTKAELDAMLLGAVKTTRAADDKRGAE